LITTTLRLPFFAGASSGVSPTVPAPQETPEDAPAKKR